MTTMLSCATNVYMHGQSCSQKEQSLDWPSMCTKHSLGNVSPW